MREIKFRRPFYDKKTDKFSFFTTWGVNVKHAVFVSPGDPNFAYAKDDEQYTCIMDRNGVVVYQGDLLLVDGKRIVEVVWHDHAGSWDARFIKDLEPIHDFESLVNQEWPIRCERLGNIHTHPELLKS